MPRNRFVPFLVVAAILAVPLMVDAQTTPAPAPAASGAPMTGPGHHHRRHRDALMHALQSLDLTDAQKQQVATFRSQERAANKNADMATRQANGAKMHDQIMGILTPDQKTQLQARMHHSMHSGPGMTAPAPSPSPNA
jgi:Spy/CpxP family protein refolding chaperone